MKPFARLARLAVLIVVPLALASCGINTIPTKDERAKAAWAEVQNQYQRRMDLIPNLVETVKGYAGHEKGTLEAVIAARAAAAGAKGAQIGEWISRAREQSLEKLGSDSN